jgi:hypothetical protein
MGRLGDKNGAAFVPALERESRYVLARGDKIPFTIIDRAGTTHPLGPRLGLKSESLKKFMDGVDPAALPSIKEARIAQRNAQKEENRGVISTLWAEHTSAATLLAALQRCGFIVAAGDKRGVFMCVDKNGYYVSLARAAGAGKQEFFDRMKGADTKKLPSLDVALATRKAEQGVWRAAHKDDWKKGRSVTKRFNKTTLGENNHGRCSTRNLVGEYTRLCKNPMHDLRSWGNSFKTGRPSGHVLPSISGVDDRQSRGGVDNWLRQVRGTVSSSPAASLITRDPMATGRAQTAFDVVFAEYAVRIEGAEKDRSLNPDQRAAAIIALRQKQRLEAEAAKQRVLEEERQKARARRRQYFALQGKPEPTQ